MSSNEKKHLEQFWENSVLAIEIFLNEETQISNSPSKKNSIDDISSEKCFVHLKNLPVQVRQYSRIYLKLIKIQRNFSQTGTKICSCVLCFLSRSSGNSTSRYLIQTSVDPLFQFTFMPPSSPYYIQDNSGEKNLFAKFYFQNLFSSQYVLVQSIVLQQYKKRMKENQKNKTRLGWTSEEEQIIKHLHQIKGEKSWTLIAEEVFCKVGNQRSGKQCRQRYKNYIKLSGEQVDRKWTQEQNCCLFQMYLEKGSKWVEISNCMNGWSENFLKNKFYGALRKLEGIIKRVCLDFSRKLKPIKYETITKILEAREQLSFAKMDKTQLEITKTKIQFCEKLRQDVINAACQCENVTDQQAADICHRAHEFNKLTRFENMARSRNLKNNKKKAPLCVKNTKMDKINSCHILECQNMLQSQDERKSTLQSSSLKIEEQGMDEQNSLCLPDLTDLQLENIINSLSFDTKNPILYQWSLSDFNAQVDEADRIQFL